MKANKKGLRNRAHILQVHSIKDYSIADKNINSIFDNMANSGGFESRNLSAGVDILKRIQGEKDCTKFLSFVGALISTGSRGIIRDMLKNKMFDCVITTCGALDHDIARTYGKYYAGDFRMDDSILLKQKIHRLGVGVANNRLSARWTKTVERHEYQDGGGVSATIAARASSSRPCLRMSMDRAYAESCGNNSSIMRTGRAC